MNRWTRPGLVALAAASLAACEPPKPAGPPTPSTAYAKVMPGPGATARGQCLNDQEAQTVRGRMVQQEVAFAARHCNMVSDYNQFAGKFDADLRVNGNELGVLLRRRGVNINTYVTDVANKVATRGASYGAYCTDAREAFRWALRPATTQLAAVPPLYDNSADHTTKPCTPPAAAPVRR